MTQPRTFPTLVRALSVAVLCIVVGVFGTVAGAAPPSREDVKSAKERLERIEAQLARIRDDLAATQAELQAKSDAVDANEVALERVQADLQRTRAELDRQQARYDEITARLSERAVEAYIQGPASGIDFVLGAQSVAELTDRIAYADALAQADAELAVEVANIRNALIVAQDRLGSQRLEWTKALEKARSDEADVLSAFQHMQGLLARQRSLVADARRSFQHQKQALQDWLEQQRAQGVSAGGTWTGQPLPSPYDHVLTSCPVDQPRGFGDGFGAPRYAGGYHLHKGVDIVAPYGTPIRAAFDGYAHTSSNTLGGQIVSVVGRYGTVYNAHLQRYSSSSNGPVSSGEVIGYVGDTGDATGIPHDHFEFHPNVMPATWPESAYGYSRIEDAINPYPLLVQACG
jgi:murein DD-endopeptidase MepM/ murein hydrolase activator NlpD